MEKELHTEFHLTDASSSSNMGVWVHWYYGNIRNMGKLGSEGILEVLVHWDYGNIRNMGKLGSMGASLWEYWNNESMGIIRTMEILRVGTMYQYVVLIFGMGILGVWVDLTYIESMGIIPYRNTLRVWELFRIGEKVDSECWYIGSVWEQRGVWEHWE